MEYMEFLRKLQEKTEEKLGEEVKAEIIQVQKNNGRTRSGILFKDVDAGAVLILYPEEVYQCFRKGADMESCAKKMAETYLQARVNTDFISGLQNILGQWEEAGKHLIPILLNTAWNREFLEKTAHVEFLDLSVCFRLQFGRQDGTRYGLQVSKSLMESWRVSEEELMRQALENLDSAGCTITQMAEAITRIGGRVPEEAKELVSDVTSGFAVLSNRDMAYGAAAVLKKGLLGDYANSLGRNLFLIPSSIDEFIIQPEDGRHETKELNAMIQEVNCKQVEREKQLSDHVYYYDREKDEVRITD